MQEVPGKANRRSHAIRLQSSAPKFVGDVDNCKTKCVNHPHYLKLQQISTFSIEKTNEIHEY